MEFRLGLSGSRRPPLLGLEGERDVADGADVLGDIVAGGAVAAGGGVFQGAVLVEKGNGHAIDLGFQRYVDILSAEVFPEALVESDQLGLRGVRVFQLEHIIDAEHGDGVGDLGEAFEGLGADALGGGVGIGELGVSFLQILEFAEQLVVIRIGDFRFGVSVIEAVVVVDELAQFRDALLWRRDVGKKI